MYPDFQCPLALDRRGERLVDRPTNRKMDAQLSLVQFHSGTVIAGIVEFVGMALQYAGVRQSPQLRTVGHLGDVVCDREMRSDFFHTYRTPE